MARAALEEGAAGLERFSFHLFSPVAPMLAQTADTTAEALERLGEAALEFKLDGARIQFHKGGERVKIFTRQLQEVTDRLPEIVEWTRALPAIEVVSGGGGDCASAGWNTAAVPEHDAAVRPDKEYRGDAAGNSTHLLLFRLSLSGGGVAGIPPLSEAV